MHLNGLAKTTTLLDGQVTATFLPYLTLRARFNLQDLETVWGASETWANHQTNFWLLVSTLMDLKATKKAQKSDYRVGCLLFWWSNQGETLAESYRVYEEVMDLDTIDALVTAFNETRVDLPRANPALAEGKPEDEALEGEGLSAGEMNLEKSSI